MKVSLNHLVSVIVFILVGIVFAETVVVWVMIIAYKVFEVLSLPYLLDFFDISTIFRYSG